jgi:hypothetical protein
MAIAAHRRGSAQSLALSWFAAEIINLPRAQFV